MTFVMHKPDRPGAKLDLILNLPGLIELCNLSGQSGDNICDFLTLSSFAFTSAVGWPICECNLADILTKSLVVELGKVQQSMTKISNA